MWVARVRVVRRLYGAGSSGAEFECGECGTKFDDAKGCSRHTAGCKERKKILGVREKPEKILFREAQISDRFVEKYFRGDVLVEL